MNHVHAHLLGLCVTVCRLMWSHAHKSIANSPPSFVSHAHLLGMCGTVSRLMQSYATVMCIEVTQLVASWLWVCSCMAENVCILY